MEKDSSSLQPLIYNLLDFRNDPGLLQISIYVSKFHSRQESEKNFIEKITTSIVAEMLSDI